jgi:hypothetical protein
MNFIKRKYISVTLNPGYLVETEGGRQGFSDTEGVFAMSKANMPLQAV